MILPKIIFLRSGNDKEARAARATVFPQTVHRRRKKRIRSPRVFGLPHHLATLLGRDRIPCMRRAVPCMTDISGNFRQRAGAPGYGCDIVPLRPFSAPVWCNIRTPSNFDRLQNARDSIPPPFGIIVGKRYFPELSSPVSVNPRDSA
jgi:hypothetical protein